MTREEAIYKLNVLIRCTIDRATIDWICHEVIEFLESQMPRVMTLEEARETIRDGGEDVIFWEEKMSYNPHRLSIGLRIPEEFTFANGDYAEFDVLDDPEVAPGYGSLFRLWTSKPSPEQMANTPWEGEKE